MVMKGDFKVELVEAHTKIPFKEQTKDDGQTYIEAKPDVEYFISIQKLGIARSEDLIARCLVDGQRTGWQRNYPSGETDIVPQFYGASDFEYDEDGVLVKETKKSLVFATPTFTTSPTSTKFLSHLKEYGFGTVEFQLYERGDHVLDKNRRSKTSEIARSSNGGTSITSVDDNASKHVFSEVGKKIEVIDKHDNGIYTTTYKRGELLQSITLQYCTVPRPRTLSPTSSTASESSSSHQADETVVTVSPASSPPGSRHVLVLGSDRDDSPANGRKDNPEGERVPPSPPGLSSLDGTASTNRVTFQHTGINPPVVVDGGLTSVSGRQFQGSETTGNIVGAAPANGRGVIPTEIKRTQRLASPPGLGGGKGLNPAAQHYQGPAMIFANSGAPLPPQRGSFHTGMPTGIPQQSMMGPGPQNGQHFFEGPTPNGNMNPHHHHNHDHHHHLHHQGNGMQYPVQFQQGPSSMNGSGSIDYIRDVSLGSWHANPMVGASQQDGAPSMFNGCHPSHQQVFHGQQLGNGFTPTVNGFRPDPYHTGPPSPSFDGNSPTRGQPGGYMPNHPGNHHRQFRGNGAMGMGSSQSNPAMAGRGGILQGAGIAAPGGTGYGHVGYVAMDLMGGAEMQGGNNNFMGGHHSPHPSGSWDGSENMPPPRGNHKYRRHPKQGKGGPHRRN